MIETTKKAKERIKIHLWVQDRLHSNLWGWIESIAMTLLIIVTGYYITPNDPFFIQEGFPWTWIVPILLALRYGLGPAFLSVIIMVTWFWRFEFHPGINLGMYKIYFLGGMITTMLCGEFSAQWQSRVRRSNQFAEYAEERLENLAKTYFVTRLSHDRLEQSLISRPATLRSALEELRGLVATHQGNLEHESAYRLLQILAQYCSLQQAGIFVVKSSLHLAPTNAKELLENTKEIFQHAASAATSELHHIAGHQTPTPTESKIIGSDIHFSLEPLAHIGAKFSLLPNDILLEKALENNMTNYYAIDELGHVVHSEYLAVVPLHADHHRLVGLLLIRQMPFLSLKYDILQVLTILTNYYTYQIANSLHARLITEHYPDCPPEFGSELIRLLGLKNTTNANSSLVAIYVKPDPRRQDIILQLRRHIRGLDYFWHTARGEVEIIITLMPLCGSAAVDGYIARTERWLYELFRLNFNDKGAPLFIHAISVSGHDPVEVLNPLLEHINTDVNHAL